MLRRHRSSESDADSSSNTGAVLVAIVLLYQVCNTPRLVLNLAEYLKQDELALCPYPPQWLM
jgi:hypothetical protein